MKRDQGIAMQGIRRLSLPLLFVLALAAAVLCALCGCGEASIDSNSPHALGAAVMAGSDQTEDSQYAEVRLMFAEPLKQDGDLAQDLTVTLNGEAPDSRSIRTEVSLNGINLEVRLIPSDDAAGTDSSVYFALYDGLIEVSASSENGALPHLLAQDSGACAVLDNPVSFTVPSGVEVVESEAQVGSASDKTPASVTFEVLQSAQLRCCTWFSFGDDFPLVMVHNHEFLRDTPETFADRLVQTINDTYGDSLKAKADGSIVTVRAREAVDGQVMDVNLVEGADADPAQGIAGTGAQSKLLGDQTAQNGAS